MGLRLVWDFTGLWIEKNKHESVPESEGQRASVQSGSGLGCAQQRGLRLSAGPLSVLLQGPPMAGDTASAQRLLVWTRSSVYKERSSRRLGVHS